MNQEIVGELSFDPSILEKVKADPRFLELVKTFVTESAALTVRIANELSELEDEDALKWKAETVSAHDFVLLSTALGVVLNNSFYYADYSPESWGWTPTEILGTTAFGDHTSTAPMTRWADDFAIVMEDRAQELEELISQME